MTPAESAALIRLVAGLYAQVLALSDRVAELEAAEAPPAPLGSETNGAPKTKAKR